MNINKILKYFNAPELDIDTKSGVWAFAWLLLYL